MEAGAAVLPLSCISCTTPRMKERLIRSARLWDAEGHDLIKGKKQIAAGRCLASHEATSTGRGGLQHVFPHVLPACEEGREVAHS